MKQMKFIASEDIDGEVSLMANHDGAYYSATISNVKKGDEIELKFLALDGGTVSAFIDGEVAFEFQEDEGKTRMFRFESIEKDHVPNIDRKAIPGTLEFVIDQVRASLHQQLSELLKSQMDKHFPGVPHSDLDCLQGILPNGIIQYLVNGKVIMETYPIEVDPIDPLSDEFKIGANHKYKLY